MSPDRNPPTIDSVGETPGRDRAPIQEHHARLHADPFRDDAPDRSRKTGQSGVFHPIQAAGRYSVRPSSEESLSPPPPSSTIPADPEGRTSLEITPTTSRASEETLSERVTIPLEIRESAKRWLATGELEISPLFSARQARSLQRAMLLVLMQEAPLRTWPTSLVQRAGWLFRPGWDHDPVEASACLDALQLPADRPTRSAILDLVAEHLGREAL